MGRPFDRGELKLYFRFVLSLLSPGNPMRPPSTYGDLKPSAIDDWSEDEVELLLVEGRRQLDSLAVGLEQIRSRGQYVFTIALALLVAVGAGGGRFVENLGLLFIWFTGATFILLAFLGAAATYAATGVVSAVDVVLLTSVKPHTNITRDVAASYPRSVMTTADTVRMRFSLLRDAIWFLAVGALIEVVAWAGAVVLMA